ncbi:MAG: DUF971 domain-containing protein [Phycisphaerae bacterium]|nr:DUF971 domain-containing protein [Phycisphaerae bacterium]
MSDDMPRHLDLKKDRGLAVTWTDGSQSFFPIAYLRKMSPSAEMRELRQQMQDNPLTVLPKNMAEHDGPITATDAELVGNYAIRIRFSDGHHTGLFSWDYLRQIDVPDQGDPEAPGS